MCPRLDQSNYVMAYFKWTATYHLKCVAIAHSCHKIKSTVQIYIKCVIVQILADLTISKTLVSVLSCKTKAQNCQAETVTFRLFKLDHKVDYNYIFLMIFLKRNFQIFISVLP